MGTSQLALFDLDPSPAAASPRPSPKRPPRPADPAPSPVFWIEEVRLLRSFSPKPRQELRRIHLRRGLNIVWAPPLSGEDPERRFSGHAAGKTSFCRLLRYLLGESACGSKFLCQRLQGRLPKGWVVAKIWVRDQPWIVARPFTGRRRSICSRDHDLDTWLQSDPAAASDFELFRVTLHQAVLESLPVKSFGESGQSIRFLHLLGWLARDQECRLNGLLSWRHQESRQSVHPPLSHNDRGFLVRAVVGVMDQEVRQEMEHRVALEEDLRKLPAEMSYRRRLVREAIEELQPLIDDTHPNLADPLFAAALESRLDRQEEEALLTLETSTDQELEEKRTALDVALQKHGAAENAVHLWETEPCGIDPQLARQFCPFHVEAPDPLPRQRALVTKNRLREFQRAARQAAAEVEARRQAYQAALEEQETLRQEQEAVRRRFQGIRQEFQRAVAAQTTLDALSDMRQQLAQEIAASQERQEMLQRRWDRQASHFASIYRNLMKRLLGEEIEAECRFTRETIRLQASCHGDLNSAAINTLVTLGFDLAALRSSIQGHGHHPRFLIHDSPREADMDAHLYRRLFHFAHQLEGGQEAPAFQYIITSTEPPPAALCQEPWLRLRLDASEASTRLFCTDL